MNSKARKIKKKVVTTDFTAKVLSRNEISKKVQVIEKELKSSIGKIWILMVNLQRMISFPLSQMICL